MVAKEPETEARELPEHLYVMGDGMWGMWRWMALRGAGFAANKVLELAASLCALAADRVNDLEQAVLRSKLEVITALKEDLLQADAQQHVPIVKALRALKKNKQIGVGLHECSSSRVMEAAHSFEQAQAELETAKQDYLTRFEQGEQEVSQRIRGIAETDRFREAVTWQNRRVLYTGINNLLKDVEQTRRLGKRRHEEQLIANYLQRYCTKNDTIGFFGPVGWAKINTQEQGIAIIPGEEFLAQRTVYFEGWCIDAVCAAMSKDRRLQPWIAPRRACFLHLEAQTLHLPSRPPVKLAEELAAVLEACDGKRTAKQICKDLAAHPSLRLTQQDAVLKILEELEKKGLIVWTLESTQEAYPERALRLVLERIDDELERKRALGMLDEMEEARLGVSKAAGDAKKLDEAIGALEEVFTRITGEKATRSDGQMYAARTLIYEDCRRDLKLQVGQNVIKEMEGALSLLLRSGRWFIHELGKEYDRQMREVYTRLVSRRGSKTIDFMTFWYMIRPLFLKESSKVVEGISGELQRRWGRILRYEGQEREVKWRSEELRQEVRREFETRRGRWSLARYHSPDIMIAARDEAAVAAGDYKLILGELHIGVNTIEQSIFVNQHPQPEELLSAIDADSPQPKVVLLSSKSQVISHLLRSTPALCRSKDIYLQVVPEPVTDAQSNVIPSGELVIEERGNDLLVRTRDGRIQFNILEAVAPILGTLIERFFNILPPSPHTPRLTIDNVVIYRESWSWPASDLVFAFEKDRIQRFRLARRWAKANHLPRFVFVRSSLEVKPFYLDFDSPIYVDIFTKLLRRYAETDHKLGKVTLSEMLPTLDQTWLSDYEGNHYTSELRMVCVDRESL